ncbi:MAG TPA: hypothetical protein VF469_13435 [Kofleriaceae bacterium]
MWRLSLVVLLASCGGDPPHRTPDPPRASEPPPAESARAAEPHRAPEAVIVSEREHMPPAADPRAATRQAAHDVLAEHCGECHEGHRSTNAKALAVYDLDQLDWPSRFNEQRFASALRRLASKPETTRAAFIAFRDAELAASSARAN